MHIRMCYCCKNALQRNIWITSFKVSVEKKSRYNNKKKTYFCKLKKKKIKIVNITLDEKLESRIEYFEKP